MQLVRVTRKQKCQSGAYTVGVEPGREWASGGYSRTLPAFGIFHTLAETVMCSANMREYCPEYRYLSLFVVS